MPKCSHVIASFKFLHTLESSKKCMEETLAHHTAPHQPVARGSTKDKRKRRAKAKIFFCSLLFRPFLSSWSYYYYTTTLCLSHSVWGFFSQKKLVSQVSLLKTVFPPSFLSFLKILLEIYVSDFCKNRLNLFFSTLVLVCFLFLNASSHCTCNAALSRWGELSRERKWPFRERKTFKVDSASTVRQSSWKEEEEC